MSKILITLLGRLPMIFLVKVPTAADPTVVSGSREVSSDFLGKPAELAATLVDDPKEVSEEEATTLDSSKTS